MAEGAASAVEAQNGGSRCWIDEEYRRLRPAYQRELGAQVVDPYFLVDLVGLLCVVRPEFVVALLVVAHWSSHYRCARPDSVGSDG